MIFKQLYKVLEKRFPQLDAQVALYQYKGH